MTISRTLIAATLASLLAACSSGPPGPDGKMNAQSSIERFEAAYLTGRTLVEQTEFQRARSQVAGTGKVDLIARVELLRCATRVASLAYEPCTGFDVLKEDAGTVDRAYAAWLAGTAQADDIALLPATQRAVAAAASDTQAASAAAAIKEPLAKLVAAGVLLRANRATPALLEMAVATASDQGWRRPLLAWLGVQRLRAQQAGDAQEAQRIARRMALVGEPPAP